MTAGRLSMAPGSVLTISGSADRAIVNAALENWGRIVWTDAGRLGWLTPSGIILNQAGGVWEIQGDASLLSFNGYRGSITNSGTVLKTAGAGANVLDAAFNNLGKVEIFSGAIRLANAVELSSSSILSFGIGGPTAVTQHGWLLVDGALTLRGTVEASLKNGFLPETNQAINVLRSSTLNGAFSNSTVPVPGSLCYFSPEYTANQVVLRAGFRTPTPATFTAVGWAGGGIHIQFTGGAGEGYRLDTSTNLIDWVPLFSTNLTTSVLEFIDPSVTNHSHLFYRAIALP